MKPNTRKNEIIKTAATLFKDKGYSAVTMRDIAKAMGIKAASLYNHINSKQDILKAIIISLAEEFTLGMETIKASQVNSIEKLKQIISMHINITSRNKAGMATLNNDWMHLEDQLEYYLKLRVNYEDNLRDIIRQGILDKEILNDNLEVLLFSLLSTLRSLYIWIPLEDNLNEIELSQSLSNVLINGIKN
jgi:AcrR family transcriptional regulator